MKNLGQMMRQAQEMQAKMAEMQNELAATEVTGMSGGGMVRIVANGKGEVRSVKIDPALVDPNEIEVLEDLVAAAVNDVKAKVEATMAERMRALTGGLELPPGFKLPF
jgi:hypothetical protein